MESPRGPNVNVPARMRVNRTPGTLIDGCRAWRIWLPVVLLVAIAAVQVWLASTRSLSPWKGGGFGMFSSTDGGAVRHARIHVESAGKSREITVTPSLEAAVARAEQFPSPALLRLAADAVVHRERRNGRPVSRVTIDIYRTRFGRETLSPTVDRIGGLTLDVRPES